MMGFINTYLSYIKAGLCVFALVATAILSSYGTYLYMANRSLRSEVTAQTATIDQLNSAITSASLRAQQLGVAQQQATRNLLAAVQRINDLGLPENDSACDYPAGTRGVFNKAAGY